MSLPQWAPTNFVWGRHQHDPGAHPHKQIRCMLLDVLTSPSLPSGPHAPQPYFGTKKSCWRAQIQNPTTLCIILTRYGLQTIPGITRIELLMFTETRIETRNGYTGLFNTIEATIEAFGSAGRQFDMPKPTSQDIVPTIGWDCVAAIIAHEARILCDDNGVPVDQATYGQRVDDNPDPLSALGYLGWPGSIRGQYSTFRRVGTAAPPTPSSVVVATGIP
ncbi:uncharacterized protein PAC_13027 [Phialocephala subalpina]|uniref:Uncharacterized protein n=1 Tax=Phialocephala subalpina TaxID=576137 RepID=A0A1L7XDK7_9HELO|nr:uncharacterized protein PAC_13027 [Phialocephala subalpina]